MDEKIKLGVSACLMGEQVRWNGGHARDRYLTDILGQYVTRIWSLLKLILTILTG
jgi:uncharacterized protein YbbK (DUF523 family)